MKVLCDMLKLSTARVVALWEEASAKQPWLLLPQHDRVDHLPEVIEQVADAVLCDQPTRARLVELARGAAKHGQDRVRQGMPDMLVLSEYHLLRDAIWQFFREAAAAEAAGETEEEVVRPSMTAEAILRVDGALTVATRASLLGYHRDHLESTGRWDGAMERLVDDGAFLFDR